MGHSYETCMVLIEHGFNLNAPIDFYGGISQCAVEADNLDWDHLCVENHANPTLE